MTTSLKASHAPRYAALARLLLKHRGAALGDLSTLGEPALDPYDSAGGEGSQQDAEELVTELTSLGPTFIKLGQLLSTRADLLPPAYLLALSKLRDDVEPLDEGVAESVIEEELGVRVSKAFGSFDSKPLAAASLGQVHRATLRDGRPVAIKVQRPGIRKKAADDMEVIAELAAFVDGHSAGAARFGFTDVVEEFRRSLADELDYRREASNLKLLADGVSGFRHLLVPQAIDDFTTSKVLTMDYVDGRSVGSVGPLGRIDLDCEGLAEELIGAYLDQILVHGFFHADPHPGNVLLTPDGRLALIDLGMVARLSPNVQDLLLRLILAVSSGDGNGAADSLERLGTKLEGYDPDGFRARVGDLVLRHGDSTVGELAAGRLLGELAMVSAAAGLRPRPELTLLGKALLNLDEVARILDPSVEVDGVIESHSSRLMRQKMMQAISPAHVMRATLDAAAFVEALPRRLDKVLESVAEGKFTINLEGLDETAILRGAQKLANRVATGVLIAAFVVAAALFSGSTGGTRLGGYPVLTYVFLGLAVVVAAWVALGVLRGDLPHRDKKG